MGDSQAIVIGLLAAHDDRDLADTLAADLPPALREQVGDGTRWATEVCAVEPADATAGAPELVDAVRRRLLDGGWQLGIGLTTLPLRVARRPVAAHVSASHGVGLVSVPALGAVHRRERLRDAAAEVVAGLLGEPGTEAGGGGGREGRRARMAARSAELADPAATADAERDGTVRFAGSMVRGNLRLLFGMIAANRPTRVMSRLSRSSTAALGTGAYALSSSNIWTLADESSWPRLLAVALLSLAIILVALWERRRDVAARARVALFNIVTTVMLAIGVASLYLALFVLMTLAAGIVIPPAAFDHQVGHPPNAWDIARLGWLVASIATVGGALGSLLESDSAIREAIYRSRSARDPGG